MITCEDPMDLSVFLFSLAMSFITRKAKMPAYLARAIGGFLFTFAEGVVISIELMKGVNQQLTIILICAGIYVVLLGFLVVLGIIALRNEDYKMIRIFFLVFKIMNIVLALILGAGIIWRREKLGFSQWLHVAVVVCVVLDVLVDPIEVIIFCCWWCGGK